jgi:hypothetical protein
MSGLVKIGFTESLEDRIKSLSAHSGAPLLFERYNAAEVDDMARVKRLLHQLFSEHRVNPKREFFRLDAQKVVIALSLGNFKEVTPGDGAADQDEKAALEKVNERRGRINLEAIGILPGAVLTFSRDQSSTTIVLPGNRVEMGGEMLPLSRAAIKRLNHMGLPTTHASGSQYWMFGDEPLNERRSRIE